MPNYTEKYNLTKPLPTDLYDIEVFNENMNKVENALVELDESTYSKEEVNKLLEDNEVTITVDHTVTSTGTNPVSGAAVVTYVAAQIGAIVNYEGVAF